MCIAILKLPEGTITKRTLKNCWQSNKDGGGLMFVNDKKELIIEKGFFGFRKIYKRFREVERVYPKSKIVIHFRIATSGLINEQGCHPFRITNNIGFVHNGILSKLGNRYLSDTEEFNYTVLQKLKPAFLCDGKVIKALDNYAYKSISKFVFLDNDNYHLICNEAAGDWVDNVWFSNTGYKWGNYSYYGIYDSVWEENENAPVTYKKCETCGLYKPLSQMHWSIQLNGWLCGTCNFTQDEDKHHYSPDIIECKLCGTRGLRNEYIVLNTRTAYCAECWHDIITTFTIDCPVCNSAVVLDWNECCPLCNAELKVEDYSYQLEKLEFYN